MTEQDTGGQGTGQRPNMNYNLSYPDNKTPAEEGLTFYYNRERRLENAPDSVKNFYKEQAAPPRFGLFHSLVADKFRRSLFVVIVLMSVLIFMLSRMGYFDSYFSLDGNRLDITGTRVEDITIVIIDKTVRNQRAYTGAVDIAVSLPVQSEEDDYPVFYHRVFFSMENREQYRFTVPFNAPELLMVLQTENSTLHLRFKPE